MAVTDPRTEAKLLNDQAVSIFCSLFLPRDSRVIPLGKGIPMTKPGKNISKIEMPSLTQKFIPENITMIPLKLK